MLIMIHEILDCLKSKSERWKGTDVLLEDFWKKYLLLIERENGLV